MAVDYDSVGGSNSIASSGEFISVNEVVYAVAAIFYPSFSGGVVYIKSPGPPLARLSRLYLLRRSDELSSPVYGVLDELPVAPGDTAAVMGVAWLTKPEKSPSLSCYYSCKSFGS